MSSVAVGRIRVDGPAPSAPLHNLVDTPGVLVEDGGRWDGGVNIWGYSPNTPLDWDGCSSGTFRVKDEGDPIFTESFNSFIIYLAQNCSTFGIAMDLPDFIRRANDVLNATQSFAIERALAQGVEGLPNPYLGDSNLSVPVGTAVTPAVGFAACEKAIGLSGRRGTIHLTPAVAAALSSSSSSVQMNSPMDVPLLSPSGNAVVIGGGYSGTDPVGQTASSDTEDWIFATGPVQVRMSDILAGPDETVGMIDREANDVIYRAEKVVNVSWDTSIQSGFLVDWTSCCNPTPPI